MTRIVVKSLALFLLIGSSFGESNDRYEGRRVMKKKQIVSRAIEESEEDNRGLWDWSSHNMDGGMDSGWHGTSTGWHGSSTGWHGSSTRWNGSSARWNGYNKDAKSAKGSSSKMMSSKSGKKGSDSKASEEPKEESYNFIQSMGCPNQCLEIDSNEVISGYCDNCKKQQKWRTVRYKSESSDYVQFESAANPGKCLAMPQITDPEDCVAEIGDEEPVPLTIDYCQQMNYEVNPNTVWSYVDGVIASIICWELGVSSAINMDYTGLILEEDLPACILGAPVNVLQTIELQLEPDDPVSIPIYSTDIFTLTECLIEPSICPAEMWW